MQWSVHIKNKKNLVNLPATIPNDIPFQVNLDGKPQKVRWQKATRTLFLIEEHESGIPIEHCYSLRSMRIQRFPGDETSTLHIEVSKGQKSVSFSTKLGFHVPGQENRDKAKGSKGKKIRSPITGKVLKILAEKDSTADTDMPLFIVEAMKMENKIFPPSKGKISQIKVKVGDNVSAGQELATLDPN